MFSLLVACGLSIVILTWSCCQFTLLTLLTLVGCIHKLRPTPRRALLPSAWHGPSGLATCFPDQRVRQSGNLDSNGNDSRQTESPILSFFLGRELKSSTCQAYNLRSLCAITLPRSLVNSVPFSSSKLELQEVDIVIAIVSPFDCLLSSDQSYTPTAIKDISISWN